MSATLMLCKVLWASLVSASLVNASYELFRGHDSKRAVVRVAIAASPGRARLVRMAVDCCRACCYLCLFVCVIVCCVYVIHSTLCCLLCWLFSGRVVTNILICWHRSYWSCYVWFAHACMHASGQALPDPSGHACCCIRLHTSFPIHTHTHTRRSLD